MSDIILHHYPTVAILRKSSFASRLQKAVLPGGYNSHYHAETGFDAPDRGLSKDSSDADRRGHLLRYGHYLQCH